MGLCALVGALLQYFFLVTFLVMAAEAINLYMKLVIVLGSNIHHFIWKVAIICWGEMMTNLYTLNIFFLLFEEGIHKLTKSFCIICHMDYIYNA